MVVYASRGNARRVSTPLDRELLDSVREGVERMRSEYEEQTRAQIQADPRCKNSGNFHRTFVGAVKLASDIVQPRKFWLGGRHGATWEEQVRSFAEEMITREEFVTDVGLVEAFTEGCTEEALVNVLEEQRRRDALALANLGAEVGGNDSEWFGFACCALLLFHREVNPRDRVSTAARNWFKHMPDEEKLRIHHERSSKLDPSVSHEDIVDKVRSLAAKSDFPGDFWDTLGKAYKRVRDIYILRETLYRDEPTFHRTRWFDRSASTA